MLKSAVKNHFIRQWMAENGVMTEMAQLTAQDEQGKPLLDLFALTKEHFESLSKSLTGLMMGLQPMIKATDKLLENIQNDGAGGGDNGGGDTQDDAGGGGEGGGGSGDDFQGFDMDDVAGGGMPADDTTAPLEEEPTEEEPKDDADKKDDKDDAKKDDNKKSDDAEAE